MENIKRDYLIKTFSRTKRKDYENYIVNAVWHRLGCMDLLPVTQQYIKRTDGRYALVDLYFPQLNVGIECDEAYHLENTENDRRRELTMQEALSAYEETAGFTLFRIKAYESMESINCQIDEAIAYIQERTQEQKPKPWTATEDHAAVAIEKQSLAVSDRLSFRTIAELCRCFGKNYQGMQRSYFNIGQGYYLWCPKLAVIIDGKTQAISQGWVNVLSEDWNTIAESNDDISKVGSLEMRAKKHLDTVRLTFARSEDVLGRNMYRFIGVFRGDAKLSSDTCSTYRRVATEIDLTSFLKPTGE